MPKLPSLVVHGSVNGQCMVGAWSVPAKIERAGGENEKLEVASSDIEPRGNG
jgi:hypothetical protein